MTGARRGSQVRLHLQGGEVTDSKAVIIATGARYRALPLERWPDFEGAGIYYAATELEARGCTGSPVTVVGGANSAGQAALYLAGRGSEVSLVVRGPDIATGDDGFIRTDVQLTDDDLVPVWTSLGRRPLPVRKSIATLA